MNTAPSGGHRSRSSIRGVVLLTTAALLAVGLLASTSIILASHLLTREVNKRVQSTASASSVVVSQQISGVAALVESYASRPTLIAELSAPVPDETVVNSRLASLAQAVPGIVGAFVASDAGVSLYTYPLEPQVIGRSFAFRDWYTGLVASGRPYISEAIATAEAGNPLAVTIVDYVRGANGQPIGILGVNYSLDAVRTFSANIGKAQGIDLTVTDRDGIALTAATVHGLVSIAGDPGVRAALAGHTGLLNYASALPGGGRGPKSIGLRTGYRQRMGRGRGCP